MSIITRFINLFTPVQHGSYDDLADSLGVTWESRAVDPVYPVFAESQVIGSRYLGITDTDAPTVYEQRTAFRGLLSTLVSMRGDVIADAMLKGEVKRQTGPNEFEDVENDHPWRRLFYNPSTEYSAYEFWQDVSHMQDISAGAYLMVGRGEFNVPSGLFAIYPDFGDVRPVGNISGGIEEFIYTSNGGSIQPIERNNLIWLRHRHPVSPYESASLLERAAFESDKSLWQAIYGRDITKEGNVPPVYVRFKENITKDQADRFGREFTKEYRTGDKVVKTPVFGNSGELVRMAVNPNDLQYIEAAQLNDQQMMVVFGFPPEMFMPNGTLANSSEGRMKWLQQSIQPQVNKLCSSLTHQFRIIFDAVDSDLCIKPPSVIPIDMMQREKIREMQLRNGERTSNEFRIEDGLDEAPGGDQFYIGGSLRPIADQQDDGKDDDDQQQEDDDNERKYAYTW